MDYIVQKLRRGSALSESGFLVATTIPPEVAKILELAAKEQTKIAKQKHPTLARRVM